VKEGKGGTKAIPAPPAFRPRCTVAPTVGEAESRHEGVEGLVEIDFEDRGASEALALLALVAAADREIPAVPEPENATPS
jgi:hypothetical protein